MCSIMAPAYAPGGLACNPRPGARVPRGYGVTAARLADWVRVRKTGRCLASRSRGAGSAAGAERSEGTTVVSSASVNDATAIQRPAMIAGRAQNLSVSIGHPPAVRTRPLATGAGMVTRRFAPAMRRRSDRPLEIRRGSDDPWRIMADSELGRLTSIERTAKLIAAFLSGRDLTRGEITALLGVRVAAADRQLAAIGRHVPLIREKRRGRLHVRIDRSKVAGGAERTPIATMIAACVGASLSKLFEGTSYEKGMRDLVHYVSRDAVHPKRFQDSRRQS